MADTTLNPGTTPVPATTRLTGHRAEKTFFPGDGNHFAVLYVEVAPENGAAANALLNQVKALAVEEKMIRGVADSDEGKRTSVHVQVTQIPDAQME